MGSIDLDTGEIFPEIPVIFNRAPSIGKNWYMQFQNALDSWATDRELWGRPRAILDFLLSRMDYENYVNVQQKEIAEKLKIDKSNVSRAISKLIQKDIILPGPKSGTMRSYKLNENYGWKGKVKNYNKNHLKLVHSKK